MIWINDIIFLMNEANCLLLNSKYSKNNKIMIITNKIGYHFFLICINCNKCTKE